jgi:hypothetical protein
LGTLYYTSNGREYDRNPVRNDMPVENTFPPPSSLGVASSLLATSQLKASLLTCGSTDKIKKIILIKKITVQTMTV